MLKINLILLLIVIFTNSNLKAQKKKSNEKIKKAIESFQKYAANNPSGNIDSNYNQLSKTIENELNNKKSNSNKKDKIIILKIQEIHNAIDSMNKSWINAYTKISNPNVLDYSLLKSNKKIEENINTVQQYITQSINNQKFFLNRLKMINKKTANLDQKNSLLIGFKTVFKETHNKQSSAFNPYIIGHIEYGNSIKDMLILLKKEFDQWIFTDGVIQFYNDSTLKEYNKLYNNYISLTNNLNKLYKEVVKVSVMTIN